MSGRASKFWVHGLLFDLDGVLIDSAGAIERAWRRWADTHGLSWAEVVPYTRGQMAADAMRALLPELDHASIAREARELMRQQEDDLGGVRALPGAETALRAASSGGCAVVSASSRALVRARLGGCGLSVPPVIVGAEDVARGKPDPEGYLLAAGRVGVPPSRCLVLQRGLQGMGPNV